MFANQNFFFIIQTYKMIKNKILDIKIIFKIYLKILKID